MKPAQLSGVLIFLIILFFNSSLYSSDGNGKRPIPVGIVQKISVDVANKSMKTKTALISGIDYDNYPTKRKAVLMSFLLPGLGEKSIGSHTSAKIFYSTETALWLSLIWFNKVKNWKKEDFRVFASAEAGTDVTGKDDLYFSNIGGYDNIEDFNSVRRRSRDPSSVYDSREYYWSWSSDEARLKYKSLRFDSELAQQNIEYTIGFLILNRILSIMNTSYRYGKNQMIGIPIESAELKFSGDGTPVVSMNFIF